MSVVDHLTELRRRLMIALVAIAIGGVVCFIFYNSILDVLRQPYCDVVDDAQQCRLFATSPLDPITLRLQIAGYGGFLLAVPVVFWQVWRFVAPGLHAREKRYAVPFIVSTIVLFSLGGLIAYLTFPKALDFLLHIGGSSLDVRLNPTKYLSLISLVILAFGLSFEFPVLLVFLELVGVVSSATLRKWRRWAIVGIVTFAAVITPSQDPYTLFFMAAPMYVFYEAAIVIGRLLKK